MEIPFSPPQPEPAHLEEARRVWTLSLYSDVYSALREPTLRQASAQGQSSGGDLSFDHSQVYAEVQSDMSRLNSAEWRAQMEDVAHKILARAGRERPVNLTQQVIQPWSMAVMLNLTGANDALAARLRTIADRLLYKREHRSDPTDRTFGRMLLEKWFSWRRKSAEGDLDRIFATREISLSRPMFAGLTQTLPSFLAKAWLALLHHPDQMAKLAAEPDLIPGAVEELLRYAGIVHTLYRRATADVTFGDIQIAKDDFVILRLTSANHDPIKFHMPNRLDIARRPVGQLGLGSGPHACVGAVLVRMAVAVVTPIFLAADPRLETNVPIVWTGDSSISWPLTVSVKFGKQPGRGALIENRQDRSIRPGCRQTCLT
jgi:cytochrome P450